jgi:CLIP-associating protein 1/2
MVVVAAQIVLQDQAHLFTLLDGLSEEKKNFLTYIFSKNDVQNVTPESSSNQQSPQMQRVKKEMQKLDERLNPR